MREMFDARFGEMAGRRTQCAAILGDLAGKHGAWG